MAMEMATGTCLQFCVALVFGWFAVCSICSTLKIQHPAAAAPPAGSCRRGVDIDSDEAPTDAQLSAREVADMMPR